MKKNIEPIFGKGNEGDENTSKKNIAGNIFFYLLKKNVCFRIVFFYLSKLTVPIWKSVTIQCARWAEKNIVALTKKSL